MRGEPACNITQNYQTEMALQNVIKNLAEISVDITKKKESILKFTREKEARALAEENLRKVVTTYADATAHNLQTPIATMSLWIAAQEELNHKLLALYDYIKENGLDVSSIISQEDLKLLTGEDNILKTQKHCIQKISEIIDDNLKNLRNAIRIHDGQEVPDLVRCNIAESLDLDLLKFVVSGTDKKLINIKLANSFDYMGNKIAIDQVIINLLSNALYQIKQNRRGKVFITSEDAGAMNILRVKDTAGGASPEVVNRMFESHFTTKSNGSGVGLDFCKKVMQSFNGNITVNSKDGDYIEFTLYFPKIV